MSTETHQRHALHRKESHEKSPLLFVRHFSMDDESWGTADHPISRLRKIRWPIPVLLVSSITFLILLIVWIRQATSVGIPIERAQEHWLELEEDSNLQLWYRTWGNQKTGIPVLFVHGGPGNAISDYYNGNKRFFDFEKFFVVEIDQRGTGNSRPSVRQSWHNMKYYKDISIDQICADFELVREELNIEKWLVWGGSFGSTIGINYGTRYPERSLALILRGIYLDTAPEVAAVYSRRTYENNPKRLAEFEILYNYAERNVEQAKEPILDPNDAKRLLQVYERMIQAGDRHAIWHWHVFENNLMEQDPRNILDPNHIDQEHYAEAQSVAFFETRLWLHGSYEEPSNLLDRVFQLTKMPLWICQGRRDEVCPPKYARKLMDAIDDVKALFTARFIDAGHEDTDPVMAQCLQDSLYEFLHDHQHPKVRKRN